MFRGCDNCGHFVDHKCDKTGEELTMVCEEWTERRRNETESSKDREVYDIKA